MKFSLEFHTMVSSHYTWGAESTHYFLVKPACDCPAGSVCQELGFKPFAKDANSHRQDRGHGPVWVFEACDQIYGHGVEWP